MRRISITLFLALSAAPALAGPPTDAEVFNRIRTIQDRYAEVESRDFGEAKRTFRAIVADGVEGLDLAALTPDQAVLLAPMLQSCLDREGERAFAESLRRASADERCGAAALLMLHKLEYDSESDHPHLLRFFEHPALDETMDTWFAGPAINSFSLDPARMRAHVEDIERAILAIHPDALTDAPSRPAVTRLLDALDDPAIAADVRGVRDRIHAHLLRVARGTVAKLAPAYGTSHGVRARQIAEAVDLVEYLEGPGAGATLAGAAAPRLEIVWTRGPEAPFSSLEDLRGKIVVLDFWATWCGPCVASFPELRELQARFADRGVVIVGLTSIQGTHVENGEVIRLEGEPQREMELMSRYMEAKGIIWNVAFSDRSVIDPRYGVWGIPHVTIIDADGVVRHNGLNPLRDGEEVASAIEALLAEAGAGG